MFWNLSDGKQVENKTEYTVSAGEFTPIPDNTKVLATVVDVHWQNNAKFGEKDCIQIKWQILAPDAHKNRIIFHKLKVLNEKGTVADNAKRMLAAIDSNAGGKLAKCTAEPEDFELKGALVNSNMTLTLGLWKFDNKTGNWVKAVAPYKGAVPKAEKPVVKEQQEAPKVEIESEDIPF